MGVPSRSTSHTIVSCQIPCRTPCFSLLMGLWDKLSWHRNLKILKAPFSVLPILLLSNSAVFFKPWCLPLSITSNRLCPRSKSVNCGRLKFLSSLILAYPSESWRRCTPDQVLLDYPASWSKSSLLVSAIHSQDERWFRKFLGQVMGWNL